MNRDDFPLPLLGMIHLRNSVEQSAGRSCSPRPWTSGPGPRTCAAHRAGTQLDIVAEVRARRCRATCCWRGVSTYLAKGVFLPGIDKASAAAAPAGVLGPGSHRALAAGRGHRPRLRCRVRGLQPDPPECPLRQGPGPAPVHRPRHVPGVAGRWRTWARSKATRSAGTWALRPRFSCLARVALDICDGAVRRRRLAALRLCGLEPAVRPEALQRIRGGAVVLSM